MLKNCCFALIYLENEYDQLFSGRKWDPNYKVLQDIKTKDSNR